MSRHWVICTHEDGNAHVEVNHAEGAQHQRCGCGHDHGIDQADSQPGRGDAGGEQNEPHDTCSHSDLLVEIAPQPEADSVDLPLQPAFALSHKSCGRDYAAIASKLTLAPVATGPPRPASFLSLRATTLLLI